MAKIPMPKGGYYTQEEWNDITKGYTAEEWENAVARHSWQDEEELTPIMDGSTFVVPTIEQLTEQSRKAHGGGETDETEPEGEE